MSEIQTYAEFTGSAARTRIVVEESTYPAHECVIRAGAQGIYLSVADARAVIDGLMAFAEGPE